MALIEILPAAARDRLQDDSGVTRLAPALQLAFGGLVVLVAYALWLVPMAAMAPSLMMVKLVLSVALLTWGLGLFSGALSRKV